MLPALDVPVLRIMDPDLPLVPALVVLITNAPLVDSALTPDVKVRAPPAPSGLFVYVFPLKNDMLPPANTPLKVEALPAFD